MEKFCGSNNLTPKCGECHIIRKFRHLNGEKYLRINQSNDRKSWQLRRYNDVKFLHRKKKLVQAFSTLEKYNIIAISAYATLEFKRISTLE